MSGVVHFFVATQEHYVNHVAPIWHALPSEIRGDFYVNYHSQAHRRAEHLGIPAIRRRPFKPNEIVVVAGFEDYRSVGKTQTIFVNHGVGQTYITPRGAMGSYSGGQGRERAILFLCTSIRDAETNLRAYPNTPAIPVGVPYLDQFSQLNQSDEPGPIVFSFHANISAVAETRWAFPWIKDGLSRLIRENPTGRRLIGHCHPRARRHIEPFFRSLQLEYDTDWLNILREINSFNSALYVIDNSSTGYEAAALGISTLWLSPPYYRRDVHHGLRFWDAIPGPEVRDPADLLPAIKMSLENPHLYRYRREYAVQVAYSGLVDGHATERAVQAICQTVGWSPSPTTSLTNSSPA